MKSKFKVLVVSSLVGVSMLTMIGCSNTESVKEGKADTTQKQEETKQQDKKEEQKITVIDNDVVKMTILEKYEDTTFSETGYVFEIENKTDKTILVGTENISCNGVMQNGNSMFAWSVQPNKKAVERGYFFMNDGIEGIESLKNVEVDFYVSDDETYDRLTEFNTVIE